MSGQPSLLHGSWSIVTLLDEPEALAVPHLLLSLHDPVCDEASYPPLGAYRAKRQMPWLEQGVRGPVGRGTRHSQYLPERCGCQRVLFWFFFSFEGLQQWLL